MSCQLLAYGHCGKMVETNGELHSVVFPTWKQNKLNQSTWCFALLVCWLHIMRTDIVAYRQCLDMIAKISKMLIIISIGCNTLCLPLVRPSQAGVETELEKWEMAETGQWEDEWMCVGGNFALQLRENWYFRRSCCFLKATLYVSASISCCCLACFSLPPSSCYSLFPTLQQRDVENANKLPVWNGESCGLWLTLVYCRGIQMHDTHQISINTNLLISIIICFPVDQLSRAGSVRYLQLSEPFN